MLRRGLGTPLRELWRRTPRVPKEPKLHSLRQAGSNRLGTTSYTCASRCFSWSIWNTSGYMSEEVETVVLMALARTLTAWSSGCSSANGPITERMLLYRLLIRRVRCDRFLQRSSTQSMYGHSRGSSSGRAVLSHP